MIKQLIEDLAYNRITLGQGLTRAKVIASVTHASALREWVNQELHGYGNHDQLPGYRNVPCQTKIVIGLLFGNQDIMPVSIADPNKAHYYNSFRLINSISSIESVLNDFTDKLTITHQLPVSMAYELSKPFAAEIKKRMGGIRSVRQDVSKTRYQDVIERTRQKLLDMLLELHEQFPNLENEFKATEDNLNKVKNIVNNHIWGNNNPVNVATGENVVQRDITNNVGFYDYSRLEGLGVETKDIEELKAIVATNHGDKPALKEKVMKWVMPVMTGAMARGLYEQAPRIMEFVSKLAE